MANYRKQNGEGSVRKLPDGSYECIIQSKYINPDTGKVKRIKRKGNTEEEARKTCQLAVKAWEKGIEAGKNEKILVVRLMRINKNGKTCR